MRAAVVMRMERTASHGVDGGLFGENRRLSFRHSSFVIRHSLLPRSLAVAALLISSLCLADAPRARTSRGDDAFYEGLIELKLFDLLEYELRVHPPADALSELLIRRRILLGVAEDVATDPARRREALAAGNEILSRLIREHGTDERVLQWQLDLAQSLIYVQAEPYYSSILHYGPTPSDRQALHDIMEQAIGTLTRLRTYLDEEYARIDELPLDTYARLDEKGYVTALERAMPQAEYMLLWAKFYRAISCDDESPERRESLEEVLHVLTDETSLLTDAHTVTHVQAQSLLLAGMVCRRLADRDSATRYLEDATQIADSLANPEERRDLRWIVTLAGIERVRALCEAQRPADAMVALNGLRLRMKGQTTGFGQELAMALLESGVIQASERGRAVSADQQWIQPLSNEAAAPLIELANRKPAYRDEVYAVLYERIADHPAPETLHPFQQCALVAGHLHEATRLRQKAGDEADEAAMRLVDSAIEVASGLVTNRATIGDSLACEALYNLAVAEHLRGRRLDAAAHFVEVARTCAQFGRSLAAATYAVEIAAQLAEDPSLRARSDVRNLLLDALRTLDSGFADSEAARYWRFFLAQALEDLGETDEAAAVYARVDKEHPNYIDARFRAARCQALSLTEAITSRSLDGVAIKHRAGDVRQAIQQFVALAEADGSADVKALIAEADVLLAEMEVLPGVERYEEALSLLADFEQEYPTQRELIGRVLRVRIVACEATGRLEEAKQAVPRFIASSPDQAGPTLQSLFDATHAEIDRYRQAGRKDMADEKARAALLFAEQLHGWALSSPESADKFDLQALRVQLAEAYLEAGQPEHALAHFQDAGKQDAKQYDDGLAHHPRIVLGLARSLEALGRFADALPLFNRVFVESAQDSPLRFESLLGDLRCRTELGEPAQGIIDVIRQQRFMHPDMGGEELRAAFAELQRRNEQRH